jgi:hypothetical protein
MDIIEAINLLKNSNYICEFLEKSVSLKKLVELLKTNNIVPYNTKIYDYDEMNNNGDDNILVIKLNSFKKFLNLRQLPDYDENSFLNDKNDIYRKFRDNIDTFLNKYGWSIIPSRDKSFGFIVDQKYENNIEIYIRKNNILYNKKDYGNIALHISTIPPDVILKTGLKCKGSYTVYDEKRIYLFLLNKMVETCKDYYSDKNINKSKIINYIIKTLESITYNTSDNTSNSRYVYKIIIPQNYEIHEDQELNSFDNSCGAIYVNNYIPKNYITYIGKIDEKKKLIDFIKKLF